MNQNIMGSQQAGNIQAQLVNVYRNQRNTQPWQQQVQIQERIHFTMQLMTNFKLLKPEEPDNQALAMATANETKVFINSQSKEQYFAKLRSQLSQMHAARQSAVLNGMNQNPMAMMGQPGVGPPRPNGPQQFPQPFPNPQLQRPMQSSPLPGNRPQPSMAMNAGMPMANNAQQPNNPAQVNLQQRNMQIIDALARKILSSPNNPDLLSRLQQDADALPLERRQQLVNQGVQPILHRARQHAQQLIQSGKVNGQALQALLQSSQPMQQGNPLQMGLNQRQPNNGFDFNALENQQIEARRVQDQGQQVVPASNNPGFPGQNPQQTPNLAQRQAMQAANMNQMQLQAQAQARSQAQAQAQAQAHARVQLQLHQQTPQQPQPPQPQTQAQQQQPGGQSQGLGMQRPPGQLLQGQVGGLTMPQGPAQSPAMPMLTRPMATPGQPNPSTPQQRPQAHAPHMAPPNNPNAFDQQQAAQVIQQAQERAQQAQQGQQPLTEQARLAMIPPSMTAPLQQQLLKLPDAQFLQALRTLTGPNAMRQRSAMQGGAFPGGQPVPNQANMMMTPIGMQAPMMPGNPALPGQHNMNFGMQAGAMPNPQGQIAQAQLKQQQQAQAARSMLQSNPSIITATDHQPFPPGILPGILGEARQRMPPEVKTWHQLKQWWTSQPAGVPPPDMQKLTLYQVMTFQAGLQNRNNAMPGAPNPQQVGAAPLAAPGQMPPGPQQIGTPQQQLNMQAMALGPPPTAQDVQNMRAKLPDNQKNVTDDQIRHFLMKQRMERHKLLQQQQSQQQQQQFPQPQQLLQQQQNMQQRHLLQQQHMQQQQHQQQQRTPNMSAPQGSLPPSGIAASTAPSRPSTAQPPTAQPAAPPKPVSKPQQPPKAAQPSAPSNVKQGLKRPNEDGGHYGEGQPSNAAPQAPAMAPSRSQQGMVNLTPEQIANLPSEQQNRMRAHLLKAQDTSNAKMQQRAPQSSSEITAKIRNPEMIQRLRTITSEEEAKIPRGPIVQVSPENRAQMQQFVQQGNRLQAMKKSEQAVLIYLVLGEGTSSQQSQQMERTARDVLAARTKILRNIMLQDTSVVLRDELTVGPEEFQLALHKLTSFVAKVFQSMSQRSGANNAQQAQPDQQGQQGQAAPGSQTQPAQPAQAQLTPANLAINDIQQRQQQKVPAAPVAARPPFQLGVTANSPRGAPIYLEGAREVKDLKLPEKKRQRLDNQGATPVTKPSPRPGTGKDGSPDRRSHVPPLVDQRPMFRCSEGDCDYAIQGFETQALLDAHIQDAHKKIDDPVQYALDAMSGSLNVDSRSGLPRKPPVETKPAAASSRAAPQATKSGQTPANPQSAVTPAAQQMAATPMTRAPTLPGVKSSPSTHLLKTPQTGTKVATPNSGAFAKATPASVTKPAARENGEEMLLDVPAEDEQPAFSPLDMGNIFPDWGSTDMTVLDLTDQDNSWVFRGDTPAKTTPDSTPKDTPESTFKNTPTTRQSDISENDNLQMHIDLDGADVHDVDPSDVDWKPPAWRRLEAGDFSQWPPFDPQMSEDITKLGVELPDMTDDEKLLFNPDMDPEGMITMDSVLGQYGLSY